MCSRQEWGSVKSRFQEAVDEGELRAFIAGAIALAEAFVEELRSRACAPDDDWGCVRGRRSRTEWIA